ncbi:MAG: hypothetical protein ACP5QR_02220 [Rhizomicrobium sp.]
MGRNGQRRVVNRQTNRGVDVHRLASDLVEAAQDDHALDPVLAWHCLGNGVRAWHPGQLFCRARGVAGPLVGCRRIGGQTGQN